ARRPLFAGNLKGKRGRTPHKRSGPTHVFDLLDLRFSAITMANHKQVRQDLVGIIPVTWFYGLRIGKPPPAQRPTTPTGLSTVVGIGVDQNRRPTLCRRSCKKGCACMPTKQKTGGSRRNSNKTGWRRPIVQG